MSLLTKIVSTFSPEKALKMEVASKKLSLLQSGNITMDRDTRNKGASRTALFMKRWASITGSPGTDLNEYERTTLTNRSRDAFRNDPIGRAAINRPRTHVIGSGLKLKASVDGLALGLSQEEAESLNSVIEREFWAWAINPRECDIRSTLDFYQLQSVAFVSSLLSGDAFALTPTNKRKQCRYNLRVQLIESDRVSNPIGKRNTTTLRDGIQIDKDGSPVYIYVNEEHPGDTANGINKHKAIPVFGKITGRRRVMQVFNDLERPEQVRSAPFLAPILEPLRKIEDYTSNEMTVAAMQALMTVFIEHEAETMTDVSDPDAKPWEGDSDPVDTEDDELKLGEAAVVDLEEGAKANLVTPTRPNSNYGPFLEDVIMQIGAALEIPRDELMLHYSSSYSAARAAMLQAWEMYLTRRTWFVATFCQPIFHVWFDESVALGILPVSGYSDPLRRAAYTRAEWIGPKRGSIDELKEARAQSQYLANYTTNHEIEAMKTSGMDYDSVHAGAVRVRNKQIKDGLYVEQEPSQEEEQEPEGDK